MYMCVYIGIYMHSLQYMEYVIVLYRWYIHMCVHSYVLRAWLCFVAMRLAEPAEPSHGGGKGEAHVGRSLPTPGGEGSGEEGGTL